MTLVYGLGQIFLLKIIDSEKIDFIFQPFPRRATTSTHRRNAKSNAIEKGSAKPDCLDAFFFAKLILFGTSERFSGWRLIALLLSLVLRRLKELLLDANPLWSQAMKKRCLNIYEDRWRHSKRNKTYSPNSPHMI